MPFLIEISQWKYRESIKWCLVLVTMIFFILLSARTLAITFAIILLFIYLSIENNTQVLTLTTIAIVSISLIALVFTNNRFKELFNEDGILQEDRVQTWKVHMNGCKSFWVSPFGDLDDKLEKIYKKNNHFKGLEDV